MLSVCEPGFLMLRLDLIQFEIMLFQCITAYIYPVLSNLGFKRSVILRAAFSALVAKIEIIIYDIRLNRLRVFTFWIIPAGEEELVPPALFQTHFCAT